MKRFIRHKVICGAAMGLLVLWLAGEVLSGQVSPKQQPASKQTNISDKELKAFVKAYVEYHKIQQEYEAPLRNAQDPKESQRLQDEGNARLKKVLEKEGLTPETYNRIFNAVNADEQLRNKVLKMVEEQRKKS